MLEDVRVHAQYRFKFGRSSHINCQKEVRVPKKGTKTVFPSAYQELEVRCCDQAFGVNLAERWVMRCSNCQGNGYNKASYDKEHVPKPPRQRKSPGKTRQAVFRSYASARGGGRGSRGGICAVGGRSGSGRGAVGPHLLDPEEEKRQQEEREYQERLDEEAFHEAMERQRMYEQMDEERERQNREEREWEERHDYFNPNNWNEEEIMDVDSYNRKNSSINFDVFTQESAINDPTDLIDAASSQDMYKRKDVHEGVAASLKDNNKGKDVQEGMISTTNVQEHAGNDKSCVWHAADFSDGELKNELFCIRFGSVENCKKFMETVQEVAESQQDKEETKDASSTAGLLEKLSVDDKDTKEEVKDSSDAPTSEEPEKAANSENKEEETK
ncbi:Ran-binding protein 1 homolog b-like protein [Tanacetum coccineum]